MFFVGFCKGWVECSWWFVGWLLKVYGVYEKIQEEGLSVGRLVCEGFGGNSRPMGVNELSVRRIIRE